MATFVFLLKTTRTHVTSWKNLNVYTTGVKILTRGPSSLSVCFSAQIDARTQLLCTEAMIMYNSV